MDLIKISNTKDGYKRSSSQCVVRGITKLRTQKVLQMVYFIFHLYGATHYITNNELKIIYMLED